MAKKNGNPQLEDGYAKIANELLEALMRFHFTAVQYQVLLTTIRYTYSFNRKYHKLSLNFLTNAVERSKSQVTQAVKQLIEMNVLIVQDGRHGVTRTIGINKHYNQWGVPVERYTDTSVQNCTYPPVQGVPVERYRSVPEDRYKEIKQERKIEERKKESVFSFEDDWDNFGEEVKYEPL